MARSGTVAARREQNHQPSSPQQAESAAVPQPATFYAYGLRPTRGGFEVVRVEVPLAEDYDRLHQPEPQRAVAYQYLESAVMNAYIEEQR
jgi:hypothetical protein